jgi:hypothetical protein
MLSAIMNFLFVCHILFVREKNETLDTLYVTMIGMTLGTVCSFMWLLRDVIVDASISARVWVNIFLDYAIQTLVFMINNVSCCSYCRWLFAWVH